MNPDQTAPKNHHHLVICYSHLLIYSGSLYCKQYDPDQTAVHSMVVVLLLLINFFIDCGGSVLGPCFYMQ